MQIVYILLNIKKGIISNILNWKVWMPLAKIGCVLFIIHPMVNNWLLTAYITGFEYSNLWLVIIELNFIEDVSDMF